jgi:predicted  nucleic acid-binding Zn-ribbon protein
MCTTIDNLETDREELIMKVQSLEKKNKTLEQEHTMYEKQLENAVEEMRKSIDSLEEDRINLKKTLESLGEATDLKATKGDQFL